MAAHCVAWQATCSTAWTRYLGRVSQHHALLWQATTAIAQLDALQSLAAVAGSEGYCRPQLLPDSEPPQLHIKSGRHPVLDQRLSGGAVPNDVDLSWSGQRGCVVTGPNMGGKSVYTRMAGCIALLAQVRWGPKSGGQGTRPPSKLFVHVSRRSFRQTCHCWNNTFIVDVLAAWFSWFHNDCCEALCPRLHAACCRWAAGCQQRP